MPLTAQPPDRRALSSAYARCERLARDHYENFPVASRLLPRGMRPHVAAIYAFARFADDFADEGTRPAAERERLLDDWLDRLRRAATGETRAAGGRASSAPTEADIVGGQASSAPTEPEHEADARAIFVALGNTIREHHLPAVLFEDLLSAFRQDTRKTRYETFDELLDYCRRSANPVGRLVLRIAGHDDPRLDSASDDVCTALQLANFWQDLERDWVKGRLYVPLEELRAAGATEGDLDRRQLTAAWRHVIGSLAGRTRSLFLHGRPVADMVAGRLRLELRLTWLGGMRILERLEHNGFDVFDERPALGARDVPLLLWRVATWYSAGWTR